MNRYHIGYLSIKKNTFIGILIYCIFNCGCFPLFNAPLKLFFVNINNLFNFIILNKIFFPIGYLDLHLD